jgi:hypothetical protein
MPTTIECEEIRRVRVGSDVGRAREVMRSARGPVVFEAAESSRLREIHDRWTSDFLEGIFGDHEAEVRYYRGGVFEIEAHQATMVERMPLAESLAKLSVPHNVAEYYIRLASNSSAHRAAAQPLFDDLHELSRELACLRAVDQILDTVWIGGTANVTPLHYDPNTRIHGVIRGQKEYVMFPPDLRHLRCLEASSWRSPRRRFSRIGLGPLDENVFPKLRSARGLKTVLRPGDFLYMGSCWWHYVTIPDGLTISTTATWFAPEIKRLWAYWRLRAGNALFAREGT